jgi:hypothetical protein
MTDLFANATVAPQVQVVLPGINNGDARQLDPIPVADILARNPGLNERDDDQMLAAIMAYIDQPGVSTRGLKVTRTSAGILVSPAAVWG